MEPGRTGLCLGASPYTPPSPYWNARLHNPTSLPQASQPPRWRIQPAKIPQPQPSVVTNKIYEAMNSKNVSQFSDIMLISSDGTRIASIRMLLVISSPYFQKLLSSEFLESKLSEVSVSVPATCLRQILDFIYTDDCSLIRLIRNKAHASGIAPSPSSSVVHCNEVRALIELADAADYTGMERLVSTCRQTILTVMRRFPHIACTLLLVLKERCSGWCKDVVTGALRCIRVDVETALLRKYDGCDVTCGVMHLDDRAAEKVLSIVKNEVEVQTKMFQVLVAWVSNGTALQHSRSKRLRDFGPIAVDTGKMKIMEERLETAKRIATWFDVKQFRPRFLSDVVEKSGLLDANAISEAYKSVSLQYEGMLSELDEKVCSYEHENAELRARLFEDGWC